MVSLPRVELCSSFACLTILVLLTITCTVRFLNIHQQFLDSWNCVWSILYYSMSYCKGGSQKNCYAVISVFSYLARNFFKRPTTNFETRLFSRYQKFFVRKKKKIANICQFIYTIASFLFSFFLNAWKRHIGAEKINIRIRNIFSILNEEMCMWEYYISSCFTKRGRNRKWSSLGVVRG